MAGDLGRLLVIDDSIAIVDVLGEHFADLGYRVELATDGRHIVSRVRRVRPDVVLLDLRLPGVQR